MQEKRPNRIILLTRRSHKVKNYQTTGDTRSTEICNIRNQILRAGICGFDFENYGTWKKGGLILSSFCWGDDVLVVDNTSVSNFEIFSKEELKRLIFVSHNADHEAKFGVVTGFLPYKFICTMVSDQVLMAGMDDINFRIKAVAERRVGHWIHNIEEWNKDIRNKYGLAGPDYIIEDEDVGYNAIDSWILKLIYERQQQIAASQGQLFLINSLRSRDIIPLAEAEVTGFVHNVERWNSIADERQRQAEEICKILDKTLLDSNIDILKVNKPLAKKVESFNKSIKRTEERRQKLIEQVLRLLNNDKTHTKAYQTSVAQLHKIETSLSPTPPDLFVNWGSHQQVLAAFKELGMPLPTAKDKGSFGMKEGVGKDARSNWLVEHGDHPKVDVMMAFDKFKRTIHNVNSFGRTWVDKYVDKETNKVYTIFRQVGAATLRFASGNKAASLINLQQIPSRDGPEYRECFGTDPGRSIITLDYKGCEIIVMIALSNDLALKSLSEQPDQHSYMGTKCWRAVYQYRFEKTGNQEFAELAQTYEMNQSSKEKKLERTRFKESGVFPIVYGVKEGRVAAIQKFSKDEGKIFIETVENELPKVIGFVKSKAKEALNKGYVVHNTRTNSRRWFTPIINHLHFGESLTNSQAIEAESAARNTCIQGTNADIVVEAICKIYLWKKLFNIDLRFLGQVHDEIILDCPTEDAEWIAAKVSKIMSRAAQNYLIPEISMEVDCNIGLTWTK